MGILQTRREAQGKMEANKKDKMDANKKNIKHTLHENKTYDRSTS